MKKRVLSLFLCFVLCLSLCPTAAFADGEDEHIHEPEEQAPLVVSATMAPEVTEAPEEPAEEPEEEPVEEEPAEPTPEPAPEATQATADPAPEAEPTPTPEPTAEPVSEPVAPAVDDAVAAVQALIDALPAVDSVSAADYDAVQNAYDAYDALTAEQRSLITGAEAFEALFNWFNEQVMELDESCTYDENGFCTNVSYTDNKHNYQYCYQPAELDSDGYYQIGNAGQLYWFANRVISNNAATSWNAKLTANIIVNSGKFDENGNYTGDSENTTPRELERIGQDDNEYAGTFDGAGYTISGLYKKGDSKRACNVLFYVNGATIKNLTVENMYLSGGSYMGLTYGAKGNVTVENVTVKNSYIIGLGNGSYYIGAVVGCLESGCKLTLKNCCNIGSTVKGKQYVGGLVGSISQRGTVENCYSTGTVSGTSQVGAIVGNGTANNCYYLVEEETTAPAGKTAAQFKSGEVAYLLNGSKDNGTWKQTIGTDAFPNFTGGAVYRTLPCLTYTNDANNLNKDHTKVKGTCTVCGEGCQHEHWTDGGVCADCDSTAVASVSKGGETTRYFMDLGEALLAAAEGNNCTVTVLEDVSSDVTVDLSEYRANITLDLKGNTVKKLSYECGYEQCPLTVTDSASGGTLTELTLKYSTATVTGGTVTALNVTDGSISISGGTVTTLNVTSSAEVSVSGGTVGTVTLQNGSVGDAGPSITLNVSGGTVTAITGDSGSKVAVSDGTVKTLNVTDGAVSLTGGSYERITGLATKKLCDLLPAGKVFAKGSDIKSYSTTLSSDGVDLKGYSIIDCSHNCAVDTVGCCVNCGADREVIIVQAPDGAQTKYATAEAAFAAAKEYTGATVTLRKDVYASGTISLDKGTITLDLGGHTLSGGGQRVLALSGSAALTVNTNGTIKSTDVNASGSTVNEPITVSGDATLTLANATVSNATTGDIIMLSGGETTISAGADIQVKVSITDGKLTVTGGTMKKLTAAGGTVSLSGGTFDEINASDSAKSCYALLAEGYAFAKKSDTATLVDGTVAKLTDVTVVAHSAHNCDATGKCACGLVRVAQIGEGDAAVVYSSFDAALAEVKDGETITLLANVTAPAEGDNSKLAPSVAVTIDLNGKTLSGAGDLTLGGTVTIADSSDGKTGAVSGNVTVPTGGELTVTGGTFGNVTVSGGTLTLNANVSTSYLDAASTGNDTIGTLTVKSGTVNAEKALGPNGSDPYNYTSCIVRSLVVEDGRVALRDGVFGSVKAAEGKTCLSLLSNVMYEGQIFAFMQQTQQAQNNWDTVSASGQTLTADGNLYYRVMTHTCSNLETGCACGRKYVAQIVDGYAYQIYDTLEAALTAAAANQTIRLLDNVTCSTIEPDKAVTIDLNGYHISAPEAGGSITVLAGSTMTLTAGTVPQSEDNSSVIPTITVQGSLTVTGKVAVESICCESTGKALTIGKDDDTVQPSVKTLTVHGDPARRVTLKNGVELSKIAFGTEENYTLLDLLDDGQAFEEHWTEDGEPKSALYNAAQDGYSATNRSLKVVAHTCGSNYDSTTGKCACGRACPHDAFDDATGKCNGCGAQMAAKITNTAGTTYYASFKEAVNGAVSGDTITLLQNDSNADSSFKPGTYTVALNGKTLDGGEIVIGAGATVTIQGGDTGPESANVQLQLTVEADATDSGRLVLDSGVLVQHVKLKNSGNSVRAAEDMLSASATAIYNLWVEGSKGVSFNSLQMMNGPTLFVGTDTAASHLTLTGSATLGTITAKGASTVTISGGQTSSVTLSDAASIKMTGGKVTAMNIATIPQEGSTAKHENFDISGGEIGTLTLGDADVTAYASIHKGLSGGSYGKIEIKGGGTLPGVRELLKSGYAFKNSSGFVPWGEAQVKSIENVEVAKCVHQAAGSGTNCQYCNQTLAAQLDADGKTRTSFYTSFEAAYTAAPATGSSVITLLANCGDENTTRSIDKTLKLIMGGHELKDKLDITANGCLTVANSSGGTLVAIEQTGGTLDVPLNATNATVAINSLTVSGGTTNLSGGTYGTINVTAEGKTVGDLLGNGYAYYQTAAEGDSKTWLTVTNETELQNVSVGMIPLKESELSIDSSPQNPTYVTGLTLTASSVDDAAYEWYEVVNGTETAIATPETEPYKLWLTPDAGSHTYRCKVTKDGYTVTLNKTVTVAKADITADFHAPTANTGLTYNGGAQELISAGSFNGDTGCTIKYKLGEDGTYGIDASALKATNAGTYTVYYYVDGGTNYNDIGSEENPSEIEVTIAPLDIGGNSARTYYVTAYYVKPYYNGQPQTPAITLTLVHRIDTSSTGNTIHKVKELVEDEDFDCTQSVTQYTNAGFYTISFTGKGNYTGTMTVDWGIERLNALPATGSLTVYNQIAHTYTVDLASLLPALPSGYEYGKLSYELNAVGDGDDASKITVEGYLGDYSLSQGTLTLPVNAVDSTETGAIAALRVTVMPENYFPFTLTLNVNRDNRLSPIDVGKPLEGLTKDNVTSDSREALEDLLDDLDGYLAQEPGEGEKKELEELKKEAGELIERLDDAKAAMEDDAIGAADDIDASNAKPGHKGKLRSAKKAIQDALDTYGPNYTAAEKAALNEKLTRINAVLAAIEKLEESAKNDQTEKPVKTGDEATPILWIVLIVVAVGCVVVLLAARKKKK